LRDLRLRCFADRSADGDWYAHCIDLTLDAQAPTYEAAVAKLDGAIDQYIDWAVERSLSAHELLRPSPLEFRLRYLRAWLLTRLGTFSKSSRGESPMAAHATFTRQPRLTRA
jgi:predicted RNase H-like HicB family nuclease